MFAFESIEGTTDKLFQRDFFFYKEMQMKAQCHNIEAGSDIRHILTCLLVFKYLRETFLPEAF